MKNHFLVVAIPLLLFPSIAFSQLTVEEHLSMENINSPSLFGSQILYTHTSKAQWNGRTTSSLMLTNVNGTHVSLTQNEYDYAPQWSPDGKHVAFISYRNNLQQVYVMPKEGGNPTIASDAQAYISGYQWLNNHTIAYIDDEPRDSTLVVKENENGGGYLVGTEFFTNALWTFDIQTKAKKKVTDGSFRIVEFDLSPDGNYLAVVGAKNYDSYESIVHSWVEVVDLKTGSTLYKFEDANGLNSPKFSPDSKHLSFVGSTAGFAANDGLFVANLAASTTKNLTYELDPTIQKVEWIDKKTLAILTPKNGHTAIYQVNFNGKTDLILAPYWVVYDFQIANRKLIFTASRGSKTNQLYTIDIGQHPEEARPLTQLNKETAEKIKTHSSILDYDSYDGTDVQAIITYPPGYSENQKYPLMVVPHGGPDAVVLNDFNWMGQFFADNGYVVFQPNFRGSIGYGRDFYAGNRNAFGKTDFEDMMAGVDHLIESGVADENKLVIGGWSYGGYMANWAITQTNRFKASISVAGVSNLVSLYGEHEFSNREIGIWEYKSLLIDKPENYRKASPIFFTKNVNTPLLILHGANDTRSPTSQAWEMYRAMKDAKKEVEMMLYPRAGHSIGNPVQFKSVLTNWLNWANKHLE